MRKAAHFLTFAIAIFASSAALGEIAWQTNLRQAHTKAQAEGKLLLLHFYSDNCTWCDKLEEGSFRAPEVNAAIAQSFVPVKVHANTSPKLTEMFRVNKFPTDVIVTVDGRTLAHSVSPQDPSRYVAMLQKTVPALGPQEKPNAAPQTQIAAVPASNPTTSMQPPQASPAAASPAAPSTGELMMPGMDRTQATLAANRQETPSFAMPGAEPSLTSDVSGVNAATEASNQFAVPGGAMDLPGGAMELPGSNLPGDTSDLVSNAAPSNLDTGAASNALVAPTAEPTLDAADLVATPDATTPNTATDAKPDGSIEHPELAMQGYCAVTVINENKWVEGSPEFGVIHLGKLYLFTTEEKMNQFLADPMPYTPVLNEIDVVRFFEERKIVPGKREWGLKDPIYNRMFFFADEAAMNHFYEEYTRYTDAAIEVMEKAVKDANLGS